jgi:hypothetical protein
VLKVAVRRKPLVHPDENDDNKSVEDEPRDHEASAPLCSGPADDGKQVDDDRGQAEGSDAKLWNAIILNLFFCRQRDINPYLKQIVWHIPNFVGYKVGDDRV